MNILETLQNMLNQNATGSGASGNTGTGTSGNAILDGLSDLFKNRSGAPGVSGAAGPAVLGGLLGALLTSKAARGIASGAILAGGGSVLWDKFKNRILEANANNDRYTQESSNIDERAQRIIRALVYAAKSDGQMDDKERSAILEEVSKLSITGDTEDLIQQALNEPLDPARLASGVKTADEALELYTLSRAVINPDQFMERSYLDALAKELNIPADVRSGIEEKIRASSPSVPA